MFFSSSPYTQATTVQPTHNYDIKTFERDANLFLVSAQKVSDDILGPQDYLNEHCHRCESIGRVRERHFWMWWPMTPLYVDPYPYRRRGYYGGNSQDSENAVRWLVGIGAVVLGGYAIFKVAEGINRYKEASEEIYENWNFKQKLRVYDKLLPKTPHLEDIKQIADLKFRIFHRIKADSAWNLALMVSLAASSAFALLGAALASGVLMVTGTASVLACGMIIACRSGFNQTNRHHMRDARLIRQNLRHISANS